MEERFQVGVITTPHGVRGEVKVFPTTDDAKRFRRLKEVILDTGKENLTLEIESVKFFKQFVILKFKGLETPEEVAKVKTSYTGQYLVGALKQTGNGKAKAKTDGDANVKNKGKANSDAKAKNAAGKGKTGR